LFVLKQRPSSGNDPLHPNMRIKVEDAPITRSGLGSIQRSGESADRQVHDRTYFVGILQ